MEQSTFEILSNKDDRELPSANMSPTMDNPEKISVSHRQFKALRIHEQEAAE